MELVLGRLSLKPEIIPPAPELQCDDPVSVSSSHVLTGDQTSVLGNSSLLPIQRLLQSGCGDVREDGGDSCMESAYRIEDLDGVRSTAP